MNLGFIKKTIMAFVVSIFLGMSVFFFKKNSMEVEQKIQQM